MTVSSSIVSISIILSIPVIIISGHYAFGSQYDTTLMTWKGIAGDQRIFYSVYDSASNSWSPGAPIEGANTNLSPSLVSLPNGALLVWKGVEGDQRIFYSVYDRDSDSWSPVTNIEGANTNRIISLSSLPGDNNVLMTWKGVEGDQRIFYSVYDRDSDSWSPGAPIEGANTNLSPSLVGIAHIPTVLMTWKGVEGDQRIFYSVYDYATNSWSPVTNIEGANTNHYPSLASMVTRVLMTWKGVEGDQRIFYSVYDYATNSWTPGAPIEGANTSTDPSLTEMVLSTDGSAAQILMTWKGIAGDQRIFYSVYDSASNSWSPGAPIEGANTNRITSLSYLPGGNALMTWKGVEGDQRIFYSVYDSASNSWSPVTNIEGANTSTDPSTIDTVRVTTITPPTTTPPTTTPPTTTPSCPNPPPGLVAWWPGDGNADDVLGNNDGILQNGASFGSGIAGGGQAFRLDGVDDFVEIPSMNIGNTFSIDFWVYPERSANYEHLISNNFANNANFGALYLRQGNLEYFQNGAAWFQQVPGSQTIQPNTWSHITLTYDGSVTRIYANGIELSGVTTTGNEHSETFNNALRFGSSIPHESLTLQGLIDDVGLYNRVLSASEIQALSSGGQDRCNLTTATAATSEEEVVEEDVPLLPEQQQQEGGEETEAPTDDGDGDNTELESETEEDAE